MDQTVFYPIQIYQRATKMERSLDRIQAPLPMLSDLHRRKAKHRRERKVS